MKLPTDLARLVDKMVDSDLRKFKKQDTLGLLFDASTFNRAQEHALLAEQFGDCSHGDFADLLIWPEEDEADEDSLRRPAFRDDCLPFVQWAVDELFDDRARLIKRLARNAETKTPAYRRGHGESMQFQTMWFLHADGRVTFVDIDGTFIPAKKSKALVKHYRELGLRLAVPGDVTPD
jgi:hypothetical protein